MSLTKMTMIEEITTTVERRAETLREAAIKEAVEKFEKELRRDVGNIAIDLSRFFSVQQLREELVIHVRMGEEKR